MIQWKLFFFITILFFSILVKIYGQTDTIAIEEVTVTTQRTPALYSEISRVVTVIEREEIKKLPANNITDLLKFSSSIDIRQRGMLDIQADVSIRGGSFKQTLILLNGVKINDPQTGHHNMNIPVDIENIERIEILQGPGARVYGPNAFSGAINIITSGEENELKAHFLSGMNNLYKGSLNLNTTTGKINHDITVSRKSSDGYRKNTDFKTYNLFYQVNSTLKNGVINFQTGYQQKAFGANSFYTSDYPDQFEKTRTFFSNLKLTWGDRVKFSPNIYWRRNHDRFELFRESAAYYQYDGQFWINGTDTAKFGNGYFYQGHNYHMTDIFGGQVSVNLFSKLGRTSLGSEIRSEKIFSNVLGQKMEIPKPVPGEKNQDFTCHDHRNSNSFWIEHSIYSKKTALSAGFLAHYIPEFGWNYAPGIDFSYCFYPDWKWFVSVNQTFRLPTFTELYYQSPTHHGNVLFPEKALSYESGIKYQGNFLKGNASFFLRKGRNLIDWIKKEKEGPWESTNLSKMDSYGTELGLKMYPQQFFGSNFPVSYISLNYSIMNANFNAKKYLSKYVLDYLRYKLNLNLIYSLYKNLHASYQFTIFDRKGEFINIESGKLQPYKPVFLCDTKLFWQNTYSTIYLEINNLLNNKYVDHGNIPLPGIWINAGIDMKLMRKKSQKQRNK